MFTGIVEAVADLVAVEPRAGGARLVVRTPGLPQDWDRYEAGNRLGLLRWIDENPDHPERQEVIDHLHESQEEYFRFGREHFGWAMYLLQPAGT